MSNPLFYELKNNVEMIITLRTARYVGFRGGISVKVSVCGVHAQERIGEAGRSSRKVFLGGKKEEKVKGVRKGRLLHPFQGVERYSER